MSLNPLQEGAILVADSHCASWRPAFLEFLRSVQKGEIKTPQLVLMGDNFDLLFGPVAQTLRINSEAVELLNAISHQRQVIYLEGNHDFRLTSVFPKIHVIGRSQQPLFLSNGSSRIALLHGDINVPLGYRIYTSLIRNRVILFVLNKINEHFGGIIINRLSGQMQQKNHCKAIEGFEQIAKRHEDSPWLQKGDVVIEGHFHQNRHYDFGEWQYYNLGAFACNERYYVVKSIQNQTMLDEIIFHKEPR